MNDLFQSLDQLKTVLRAHGRRLARASLRLCTIPSRIAEEVTRDIETVRRRDPAAKSDLEVLLLSSGVHAILAYRVAHKL